jgi:alkylation response protein AidB-like acyl-CoA dehydrogenase
MFMNTVKIVFGVLYDRQPRNQTAIDNMTAVEIKAAALALVPEIEARTKEIAELRRLPRDLVLKLKKAGAYSIMMPRAWGGPEMSPREQIDVIEIYSAADPSVGWCVMIGSDSGFFAAFHEETAARELYPEIDYSMGGSVSPLGRAVRVPGGFRVSGRWSFGSNINNAEVIMVICPVYEGDSPVLVNGRHEMRMFSAPAASWEIIDTWHTTGLAGTGSNDYAAKDLFIPESHTIPDVLAAQPRRREPLYAWWPVFLSNMHGVPLGLARRAIDIVKAMASQKRQPNVTRPTESLLMKEVPRVRAAIARAEMSLGAARAYTYETADRLWDDLCREGRVSRETRVAIALSRQCAFRTGRNIAQLMVDTAGSSAIYRTSPLDGLLRDAITMCQHWTAQERTLELIGAVVFGDDPPGMI